MTVVHPSTGAADFAPSGAIPFRKRIPDPSPSVMYLVYRRATESACVTGGCSHPNNSIPSSAYAPENSWNSAWSCEYTLSFSPRPNDFVDHDGSYSSDESRTPLTPTSQSDLDGHYDVSRRVILPTMEAPMHQRRMYPQSSSSEESVVSCSMQPQSDTTMKTSRLDDLENMWVRKFGRIEALLSTVISELHSPERAKERMTEAAVQESESTIDSRLSNCVRLPGSNQVQRTTNSTVDCAGAHNKLPSGQSQVSVHLVNPFPSQAFPTDSRQVRSSPLVLTGSTWTPRTGALTRVQAARTDSPQASLSPAGTSQPQRIVGCSPSSTRLMRPQERYTPVPRNELRAVTSDVYSPKRHQEVHEAYSPTIVSPVRHQEAYSPVRHQEAPAPVWHQEACSPVMHQEAYSPVRHLEAPAPVRHQEAYSPVRHLEAYSPVRHQEAPAPVRHQEACSPVRHQEACSPVRHQEAYSPVRHQEAPAPVWHQEACSPVMHQEAYSPVRHQDAYSPVRHQDAYSPARHHQDAYSPVNFATFPSGTRAPSKERVPSKERAVLTPPLRKTADVAPSPCKSPCRPYCLDRRPRFSSDGPQLFPLPRSPLMGPGPSPLLQPLSGKTPARSRSKVPEAGQATIVYNDGTVRHFLYPNADECGRSQGPRFSVEEEKVAQTVIFLRVSDMCFSSVSIVLSVVLTTCQRISFISGSQVSG